MLPARIPGLLAVLVAAVVSSSASASGAPALQVVEMSVKGVKDPVAYIAATNRRGPMLATCFGTKEAMFATDAFEASVEVAPDGSVRQVTLGRANEANPPEVDACLLTQLDKARYPESDRLVKLRMTLEPVPERLDD